ncbi:MAG: replicative DNA helicase, partial [Lachnospiraceae bacterium]|nr:replicative DNA helicase [Lachnospiraceae bacterium]
MDEALIKKVMPHSEEAEQSVIGSMIMDSEAIVVAMEILAPEDFYGKQYGILFEAVTELFTEAKPADLVTLRDKLKEKDVPQELYSIEFLANLVRVVPTSANVRYYAQIVKDKAVLRNLIRVTEGISNECYLDKE